MELLSLSKPALEAEGEKPLDVAEAGRILTIFLRWFAEGSVGAKPSPNDTAAGARDGSVGAKPSPNETGLARVLLALVLWVWRAGGALSRRDVPLSREDRRAAIPGNSGELGEGLS